MQVLIPDALRSYTQGARVQSRGATLAELLADLDRQFPGIRFRVIDEQGAVRRHMRIFVSGVQVFDLTHALHASDEIAIVQALSGG
jgi:sulfur-carrier protein